MLLRTSSTPMILNSWIPPHSPRDSSSETKSSISLAAITSSHDHHSTPSSSPSDHHNLPLSPSSSRLIVSRTVSCSDLRRPLLPIRSRDTAAVTEAVASSFSSSALDEAVVVDEEAAAGDTGGLWPFVGGGIGGNGSGGGRSDSDGGDEHLTITDTYYQYMMRANPGNALLLGNYARFLKEVRKDMAKAEEYCSRAILASPDDGKVLSMYGDIIWETERNVDRADYYFDQAVKAAPDDCYVLASYAKFLWDTEE